MSWGRITEAQSVHVGKVLMIFVVAVLLAGVVLAGSATGQEIAENKTGNETKGYGNYSDTSFISTLDTTRRVDLTQNPDLGERIWPVNTDASGGVCRPASGGTRPATGPGSAVWFGFGGCGSWKVFNVQPGETYNITSRIDTCFSCVLFDDAYAVQEFVGGGWQTQETYPAITATKTNARAVEYTPNSDQIRIVNLDGNFGIGFYLRVYGPDEEEEFEEWYEEELEENQAEGGGGFEDERRLIKDPRILNVEQEPGTAEVGESVTVTVRVASQDPEVSLRYFEDKQVDVDTGFNLDDAETLEPVGEPEKIDEIDLGELTLDVEEYKFKINPTDTDVDIERGDETTYFVEIEDELPVPDENIAIPIITDPSDITDDDDVPDLLLVGFAGPERYFTFKNVEDIAVVYAKYSDEGTSYTDPGGNEYTSPVGLTGAELRSRQSSRELNVNRYMASSRGSMGIVGYDFSFFDNDMERFEVGEVKEYINFDTPEDESYLPSFDAKWDRNEVRDDAVSESDIDEDPYSGVMVVGSGEVIIVKELSHGTTNVYVDGASSDIANRYGNPTRRLYINGGDGFGTWVHELGHVPLEFSDLYELGDKAETGGQIGITGMMGGGDDIGAPFSVPSRTSSHELDSEREEHPWLEKKTVSGYPEEISVKGVTDLEPDDKAKVHETPTSTPGTGQVIEARDESFGEVGRGIFIYWTERSLDPSQIYLIQPGSDNNGTRPSDTLPSDVNESTLSEEGDSIRMLPSNFYVEYVFEEDGAGSGEDYEAIVRANEITHETDRRVVSYSDPDYPTVGDETSAEIDEDFIPPNLRLKAYDANGNKVGVDGETGEYITDIPDVDGDDVSGDQFYSEWISVNANRSLRYELDTTGIKRHIEQARRRGVTIENTSTDVTLRFDFYDKDAEFNETTGGIDNSTTTTKDVTLGLNETVLVGASSDIELSPDTLNKNSRGRWVKATIDTPHEEINLEEINISTVRLNQKVEAVTDDRYGFVRNPVEGDTLKVRFPRDEVTDVLKTGDEIHITVTGETEDGTAIFGNDEVKVIDPRKSQGRSDDDGTDGTEGGGARSTCIESHNRGRGGTVERCQSKGDLSGGQSGEDLSRREYSSR